MGNMEDTWVATDARCAEDHTWDSWVLAPRPQREQSQAQRAASCLGQGQAGGSEGAIQSKRRKQEAKPAREHPPGTELISRKLMAVSWQLHSTTTTTTSTEHTHTRTGIRKQGSWQLPRDPQCNQFFKYLDKTTWSTHPLPSCRGCEEPLLHVISILHENLSKRGCHSPFSKLRVAKQSERT